MSNLNDISKALYQSGWFCRESRVHCLVGGQYGSEGKGVAASLLEHVFNAIHGDKAHLVTGTNAGPNSGHTAIYQGKKIVTRQIPISTVQRLLIRRTPTASAVLNAGATIDPAVLRNEFISFGLMTSDLVVHGNAAIILPEHIAAEGQGSGPSTIASTGKGVGAALAAKVMRTRNVAKAHQIEEAGLRAVLAVPGATFDLPHILETAQGFSLGINQQFYPHCTSRECTVMQALSDAEIHPHHLNKTLMAVRTLPIRVGNTTGGYSGGCYPDQQETTWEAIGVEPEYTTVTKRMRRVFTWSKQQFKDAVRANRPDALLLSFVNYLPEEGLEPFIYDLMTDYKDAMMRMPDALILGYGPNTEECILWQL